MTATAEPPPKRRRVGTPGVAGPGRPKAQPHSYAQTLQLEVALPKAFEQGLTVNSLAKVANVGSVTARKFLQRKMHDVAVLNNHKLLGFTPQHAAALNETAERQMRRLCDLNALKPEEWNDEYRKLEKHTLACLKAVHPFLAMAAAVLPSQPVNHHNYTGDSPTPDSPDPEITQDDGL